jgi:hypothetical protein
MMEEKELNQYVLSQIKPMIEDFNPDFAEKFQKHVNSNKDSLEDKIIKASHYIATK